VDSNHVLFPSGAFFFLFPVLLTFIQFFFYHPSFIILYITTFFLHLHAFQPLIPEKRKKKKRVFYFYIFVV